MVKRTLWLILTLGLIFAVGCAAETLPVPQEGEENQMAPGPLPEQMEETVPTAEPPAAYPVTEPTAAVSEPEAYPADETAEENVQEKPTKTPEPLDADTPVPEDALQLQPTSPKKDPQTLKNINFAKADLAGRLEINLPSTAIQVVAYEEVIWRDSSLGCPEPDMMYAQAVVDGYVIQLQVGDQKFNYHGAKGEDPSLCPKTSGLEPEPLPGDEAAPESSFDIHAQRAINLAKADLTNTLGIEFSTIELVSYEQVTWNDGSLGCPQPDMMYTQALIDGYKIQLRIDEQVYNYHGATGEDPFLCTN